MKPRARNREKEDLPIPLQVLGLPELSKMIRIEPFVMDYDRAGFEIGKMYHKAITIHLPNAPNEDGGVQHYDLSKFNQRQLRKLATVMGIRNNSRMSKDDVVLHIGTYAEVGNVVTVDNNSISWFATVLEKSPRAGQE